MLKKPCMLFIFFLQIFVFLPNIRGDSADQHFLNQVKELQEKGLNLKQIYNELKQKNELFFNFVLRLQLAKANYEKSVSNYPYQKSQKFDPKHVLNDFYFLGDITVYGNNNDNWLLKDPEGKLVASLKANKLQQLSPIHAKTDENDTVYQDMQKFRINEGKSLFFGLSSSNKNLPIIHVFAENNQHFVTMYLGSPAAESKVAVKDLTGTEHSEKVKIPAKGFKIILNKDRFRDYLTQTFFYKLLLNNFKYPVVGFGIGFSIDSTKIAFINTEDPSQIIGLFNIKPIFKITKKLMDIKKGLMPLNLKDIKMDTYYDSERLDIQDKIKERNYEEQIKYADLFAVGAIKVEPLNSDDGKKIDSIKPAV